VTAGDDSTRFRVARAAQLPDLDVLEPLWLALYDHHRSVHPGPYRPRDDSWPHRRRHYEALLSVPEAFAVLAEGVDGLVGYAMVSLHDGPDDTWPTGDRYAEVETLVVAPDARGAGIGTRLMDVVDAELRPLGVTVLAIGVVPGNDTALALYEARGFTPMVTKLMRFPDPG
jgi:ribosomal protein S18 acetylase RimI-like enzyme